MKTNKRRPAQPPPILQLLELPSAWLVLLVHSLPADSLHALLQTCKQLRDLVLQHAPRVTLHLHLLASGLGQASKCLQLASQKCPRLGVSAGWQVEAVVSEDIGFTLFTSAFNALLTSCSSMLTNVSKLYLQGARLEGLLPPPIRQALPNLTSLTLEECWIEWGECAPASFEGVLPLEELRLKRGNWDDNDISPQRVLQLQAQLGQLSSLRALHLGHNTARSAQQQLYNSINSAVPSAQLTYLGLEVVTYEDEDDSSCMFWLHDTPAWAGRIRQHLQHLSLGYTDLSDAGLEVVLQLPSLTRLDVWSFALSSAMRDRLPPAQLQLITCREVSVRQLAWLPLSSQQLTLRVVSGSGKDLKLESGQEPGLINRAARNVARCCALEWDAGATVYIGEDWDGLAQDVQQQLFAKVLPLVKCKSLALHNVRLGVAQLVALVEHMRSCELHTLQLGATCTWDMPELCYLAQCGCLRHLEFWCANERTIVGLCCVAQGPLCLLVKRSNRFPDGFKARVSAALLAYGHKDVTVKWLTS